MAQTPPSSPQETERLVQTAVAAMQRGDFAGACAIAERGIAAGAEHPFLFKAKAFWLHHTGEYRDALRTFHHARTLDPNDPSILNGIASSLCAIGEYDAAIEIVDAALELAPEAAPTHYLRGWILEAAGDLFAARASYANALNFSPNEITTLGGLASVALRLEDFETARRRANQALSRDPQQLTAIRALAGVDIAQGNAADAERSLRAVLQRSLPAPVRSQMLSALGDALDAQGNTSEAFAIWQKKAEGAASAADPLALYEQTFASIAADAWQSQLAQDGKSLPVFLTGNGKEALEPVFALLPTVLRANSSLKALSHEYLERPEGLDELSGLTGEALDDARAEYWKPLSQADLTDKTLVEMNVRFPIDLPLIAKLFPNAKTLVIVCDPRDAVLKAFRYQAGSPAFSLEQCARAYAGIQTLAEACRARLPLTFHDVRYEELVDDFASVVGRALAFLDIKVPRGLPALSQRTRESAGAWRRYAQQLAPVLPILEPWIAKLGYPAA